MTPTLDAHQAPALTVASWNVNSIRARLDHVLTWLVDHEPDVLCLQETKVEDNLFPRVPFLELGYTVTLHGGRALAGVATLSKRAPTEIQLGFRDGEDDRAPRVLETVVDGIRIFNLYAPNGTGVGSDAFGYKLQWYARLRSQLDRECSPDQAVLVIGDFNVAPDARDVWDATYFQARLQFTPEEHTALQQLRAFGLDECFRHHHPEPGHYSWFDYRTNGFAKHEGMRIDLALATPTLLRRCLTAHYDDTPRRWPIPSDHIPLVVTFSR
jgi:exodeoxyribonuclease III